MPFRSEGFHPIWNPHPIGYPEGDRYTQSLAPDEYYGAYHPSFNPPPEISTNKVNSIATAKENYHEGANKPQESKNEPAHSDFFRERRMVTEEELRAKNIVGLHLPTQEPTQEEGSCEEEIEERDDGRDSNSTYLGRNMDKRGFEVSFYDK